MRYLWRSWLNHFQEAEESEQQMQEPLHVESGEKYKVSESKKNAENQV